MFLMHENVSEYDEIVSPPASEFCEFTFSHRIVILDMSMGVSKDQMCLI